jgi:hypothetical protein
MRHCVEWLKFSSDAKKCPVTKFRVKGITLLVIYLCNEERGSIFV